MLLLHSLFKFHSVIDAVYDAMIEQLHFYICAVLVPNDVARIGVYTYYHWLAEQIHIAYFQQVCDYSKISCLLQHLQPAAHQQDSLLSRDHPPPISVLPLTPHSRATRGSDKVIVDHGVFLFSRRATCDATVAQHQASTRMADLHPVGCTMLKAETMRSVDRALHG